MKAFDIYFKSGNVARIRCETLTVSRNAIEWSGATAPKGRPIRLDPDEIEAVVRVK